MLVGAILLVAMGAYLVGSLPTGYLVARAKGVDIRAHGSGNIGATNVFRILGIAAGVLVLLTDALKGALAVLCLPPWVRLWIPDADPVVLQLTAALGSVLGHNYTCWLRFKGGKGVATSAGAMAALVPPAFLVTLAVFLVVLATSRYVSLASILAAIALPIAAWYTQVPRSVFGLTAVLAALAIWKHRANAHRLLAGTENRLGKKTGTPPDSSSPSKL